MLSSTGGLQSLHITSLCVSGSEEDYKLLLNSENGWHPTIFGMGVGGSKDNVVADSVDYSTNLRVCSDEAPWGDIRALCWGGCLGGPPLHGLKALPVEDKEVEPGQAEGSPG